MVDVGASGPGVAAAASGGGDGKASVVDGDLSGAGSETSRARKGMAAPRESAAPSASAGVGRDSSGRCSGAVCRGWGDGAGGVVGEGGVRDGALTTGSVGAVVEERGRTTTHRPALGRDFPGGFGDASARKRSNPCRSPPCSRITAKVSAMSQIQRRPDLGCGWRGSRGSGR